MSTAAPPSPSKTPDFPPPDLQPPRRGRLFAWVARKPKTAFWVTLIAGVILGAMIGGSGGTDQSKLDAAATRATAAEGKAAKLQSQLAAMTDRAERAEGDNAQLKDRVTTLSAKGEMPDLTGMDYADARDDETVSTYHWRVRSRTVISGREPGTVLAQSPREGTTLKTGRSITLTVARKAPPKPKQWVTIKTLQGASSTKTPEFTIPSGAKARLQYSMPEDSNNIIELYKASDSGDGLPEDLLLNEIGPQSGTTRLYQSGTFYLDVTGAYTVSVQVFKRPS
jgi:outer membrane murein-binding lipoprotein Lpp